MPFDGFYLPKNLHKAYLWGSWYVCIVFVMGFLFVFDGFWLDFGCFWYFLVCCLYVWLFCFKVFGVFVVTFGVVCFYECCFS